MRLRHVDIAVRHMLTDNVSQLKDYQRSRCPGSNTTTVRLFLRTKAVLQNRPPHPMTSYNSQTQRKLHPHDVIAVQHS